MTLEEIARFAGVSRSTVSRVLNGEPYVSRKVRERVERVIQEQDFHPNAAARSLASRRTRIIGILIPRGIDTILTDPYFLPLIRGTFDACNDADYNLTLIFETAEEKPGGTVTRSRTYQRFMRGRHIDGTIIASSVIDDPIVDWLERDGLPFVMVGGHPNPAVSFVDVDNHGASRSAVEHLLSHSYSRIAMINGPLSLSNSLERHSGYISALESAGMSADPALHVQGFFTRRGGYAAMLQLLDQPAPPDAVFAASDTMASGALQAIRDRGLEAGRDIGVFGFDGLEAELVSRPVLSTVVQPIYDLGVTAANLLLGLIANDEATPVQQILPTRMDLQTSCGCPGTLLPETAANGASQEVMLANIAGMANR